MKKAYYFLGIFFTFFLISGGFSVTANAQSKGAWVEYKLPGDRPVNWARMVGDNCLIFLDRMAPEIYAFDINSETWHTYTASTSLEWNSQIKVGRNVAYVYNDEMAVAYNGLTQDFIPVTYSGTLLSNMTYGHDCEADMAYFATDQNFYVFDAEDNVWKSFDISGFGTVSGWGIYGIEDYIYLYLYAADESRKIVAYSYITKTFTEYNGVGYVEHQALQHGFVFFINSPSPDSLNHFFAGYTAFTGSYVSQMAPNNQEGWNSMVARGKPGTTYFFTDNERVVDNIWRHDMWGFDTRYGDLVYSSFTYDYVCQNGIHTYGVEAGSSVAVDSYRDCTTGELTYIVYKGNSNSFQTALEEGLYNPTCGTDADAQCGGEVIGASDCDYIWFFDTNGWLGNKAALPEAVSGFSNPAPQRMYSTWGIGECKRVYDSTVHIYSFNQIHNDMVHTFTFESALSHFTYDSTNVGGVMSNNIGGPYVLYLYSPGLDSWSSIDFGSSISNIGRGIQRDYIYWYDTEAAGPLHIFDGVTGEQISLPFGWAYISTANGRKYARSNFMLAHSSDDVYSGYSTYTRTSSEFPNEYLSSWKGQEDVVVSSKLISGGGADVLAYNVLYGNFVKTTYDTKYGTYFDIWVGGKTALIMTLPGYLMAWDPYADAVVDVDENHENGNLPDKYNLYQNYPNPFNPATVISYSIPKRSDVTISILNLLGQTIKTIVTENQSAGQHEINWDGTDQTGENVASGIYFYQIKSDEYVASKKMVLLK